MQSYSNYELYKEMYYNELSRRDSINARINIPLGVLPLLIGGGLYIYNERDTVQLGTVWNVVFVTLLVIYFLLLSISTYYLMKSYIGFKYAYLSLPSEIAEYHNQWLVYYEDLDEAPKKEYSRNKVQLFLENIYIKNTDYNMLQNERKLQFLWRCGWFLISAVAIGMILGGLFFVGQNDELKKPTRIEIISGIESKRGGVTEMGNNNSSQDHQKQDSGRKEPEPPKARIINENFERLPRINTEKPK